MNERGVAQPGSAPVLGTGGRRFESCRPDKKLRSLFFLAFLFIYKSRCTFVSYQDRVTIFKN